MAAIDRITGRELSKLIVIALGLEPGEYNRFKLHIEYNNIGWIQYSEPNEPFNQGFYQIPRENCPALFKTVAQACNIPSDDLRIIEIEGGTNELMIVTSTSIGLNKLLDVEWGNLLGAKEVANGTP